jgi:hypothetical protein
MTESTKKADSALARFAERAGINRPRTRVAAAVVVSVLIVSFFVMNQRIQARKLTSAEAADSLANSPVVEPVDPAAPRAAWADPQEARRLAGDTLPPGQAVTDSMEAGDPYVPLGSDVGPGGYADAGRGQPASGEPADSLLELDTASGVATTYASAEERPLTARELRIAAFRKAVSSRSLRQGRRGSNADTTAHPSSAAPTDSSRPAEADVLRPYGPAEAEADRRAAEQAPIELAPPSPPVPPLSLGLFRPAVFTRSGGPAFWSASNASRPCGAGERILSAGYVITATLATAINSEAPGPVLARIGRDVYGPGLRCVIFPAGTLLVGRYPSGLAAGGERLVVVWEQVVLADGSSWMLPKLPAADREGRSGIPGRVDQRTRARFADVVMLSAIGAALEYATPGGGQSPGPGVGGYPAADSPRDRAVGGATAPLRSASERLLERADAIRPVSRVEAGSPITVIVPQTVDLDRPAPAAADSVPRPASVLPSV